MATDFLSSLIDFWSTNATINATGIGDLNYGVAPPPTTSAAYPYAIISKTGGKVSHRTFTGGYLDEDRYKVSLYASNEDQAVALGSIVTTAFDTLATSPLSFDGGTQVVFLRTGDGLMRLKTVGVQGVPFVWLKTLDYVCKTAGQRP